MPQSTNHVRARKYLVPGVNHGQNNFAVFLIRTIDDVESFFSPARAYFFGLTSDLEKFLDESFPFNN